MPNITFNVEGIFNLFNSLHDNKAPGPDEIPSRILEHCATKVAPMLQVLFTRSMSSRVLPNDWLTANITPIFKKGDTENVANYRPISLKAVCCKIMEHKPHIAWLHCIAVIVCFAVAMLASLVLVALRLHCCSNYNCGEPNGKFFFAPDQLNKCVLIGVDPKLNPTGNSSLHLIN